MSKTLASSASPVVDRSAFFTDSSSKPDSISSAKTAKENIGAAAGAEEFADNHIVIERVNIK
jgi:hypothetical protein